MADLVVVEHDTVVVVQEIGTQVVEVASAGPQGIPGPGTWAGISDKPTVIAAGATQAEARTAIGAVADNDARLADQRTPTGAAGGVLSGAYPNPGFAVDMATQAELDAHASNTSNPHAVTAAQAGADPAGTAAAAVAAHTATPDPHPQYTTTAEAAAAAPVQRVAGKTGAVVLAKADVGLGNVDNTSDAAKPVSTAQQTALNLKADLASPTFTGTVSGVTKAMVGLANADNTSDAAKPVSTATQTALDAKQNSLGFTPIQQGGGTGQWPNKIYVGWAADGSGLMAQVDATNFGTNWPINISKNAATATKLATARAINGVSFDGSANININAAAVPNTPAGSIVSTSVQTAIDELDAVKVAASVTLPDYKDLNTVVASGFYRHSAAGPNALPGGIGYGQLIVSRGLDTITQIYGDFTSGALYSRAGSPPDVGGIGLWQPWRKLYDQRNILGTVSQSAGVPTGAVIERGSNANGEYVKFADGTAICTRVYTGGITGGNVTNTITFPLAPIGVIAVSVNAIPSLDVYGTYTIWAEGTVWQVRFSGATNSQQLVLLAIGRWC